MQKPAQVPVLALLILALLLLSCGSKSDTRENTPEVEIVSATPPFSTQEPPRYQATRTITFSGPSGTVVITKTFIAKDGPSRREDAENPDGSKVVYLDLSGRRVVMLPDEKIYSDASDEAEPVQLDETLTETSPDRLLHSDSGQSRYLRVGQETTNGRATTKFKVTVNISSSGSVSSTETFVWVDQQLGMPVKTETASPDGSRTVTELTDVTLAVEKALFEIPKDYQKVAPRSLRESLQKKR